MGGQKEFSMTKPTIFHDLDWVSYGETGRHPDSPMAGNFTDRPEVLNLENYNLIRPDASFDDWREQERQAFLGGDAAMRRHLGLDVIAHPYPVHGVDMIELNDPVQMAQFSAQSLPEFRPRVDAATTHTPGYGVAIAPADCLVLSVANPSERAVGQIHAGYIGLANEIIQRTFRVSEDIRPNTSLVHISAHAHALPLFGEVLDRFRDDAGLRKHLDDEGRLHMASLAVQQLCEVGVKPENISTDPRNTMTDPTLFSHRVRQEKGANGRNGTVIGIKNRS